MSSHPIIPIHANTMTTHSLTHTHTPQDNKHSRTQFWIKDMGTSWK